MLTSYFGLGDALNTTGVYHTEVAALQCNRRNHFQVSRVLYTRLKATRHETTQSNRQTSYLQVTNWKNTRPGLRARARQRGGTFKTTFLQWLPTPPSSTHCMQHAHAMPSTMRPFDTNTNRIPCKWTNTHHATQTHSVTSCCRLHRHHHCCRPQRTQTCSHPRAHPPPAVAAGPGQTLQWRWYPTPCLLPGPPPKHTAWGCSVQGASGECGEVVVGYAQVARVARRQGRRQHPKLQRRQTTKQQQQTHSIQ